MADRIAVMNAGKLLQVGTPQDIYSNPAAEFVAGFVGEPAMNLMDAKIVGRDGQMKLEVAGKPLELPSRYRESLGSFKGDGLRLGIRPSDIQCFEPGARDDLLAGEVVFVEPRNESVLLNARVDEFQVFALAASSFRPKPKSRVCFKLNEEAFHLFDPDSGDNLNRAKGG